MRGPLNNSLASLLFVSSGLTSFLNKNKIGLKNKNIFQFYNSFKLLQKLNFVLIQQLNFVIERKSPFCKRAKMSLKSSIHSHLNFFEFSQL